LTSAGSRHTSHAHATQPMMHTTHVYRRQNYGHGVVFTAREQL